MEFNHGTELLELCEKNKMPISLVMKKREAEFSGITEEEVEKKMRKAWKIMKESARKPLKDPVLSIGGLIGGEAKKLKEYHEKGRSVCGDLMSRAITYAMAVLEVNASMGVIVAAPTAGSSGVVPGVLLALQEEYDLPDEEILNGLYTAGAVGYLLMRNASVAGAEAGCQAEVGAASAMAAAAAVEIMGGTPVMCLNAASGALANLLGLVCDPIAGLVEAQGSVQLSLYDDDKRRDKWERIDAAVDCLRQRYGYMSIRRALLDTDPLLGRINVKDGHTVHPVGFFGG